MAAMGEPSLSVMRTVVLGGGMVGAAGAATATGTAAAAGEGMPGTALPQPPSCLWSDVSLMHQTYTSCAVHACAEMDCSLDVCQVPACSQRHLSPPRSFYRAQVFQAWRASLFSSFTRSMHKLPLQAKLGTAHA